MFLWLMCTYQRLLGVGERGLDDIIKTEVITKHQKKKPDRTVSDSGLQRNKMLTVTCLSDLCRNI